MAVAAPSSTARPSPERILVGVAWPYSNGPQHVGHLAGNLLPADIFARFHRLRGHEVLMVSGSDMHGTPTTVKAEAEGVSPEVVATRFHDINRAAFERLGLSFDLYTSTHTPTHEKTVQEIFLTLLENRYLEKRKGESPFCEKDQRFLPDRYVLGTCPHCGFDSARGDECDSCARVLEPRELGSPRCRICGTPAVFRETEHFYFLLPKLSDNLRDYHATVRDHWRPSVRAFTENYLAAGLQPRPITRDILWGVPIPLEGYGSKRIYVWFEAVIGYLSATREWGERHGRPDEWRRWWLASEPVRVYQFQGKDNITFHTIMWPAILLAVGGLQLPYDGPANEFLNVGGRKLAKSRMTAEEAVSTLPELLARFDPEVVRFCIANHLPQNHDTEFHMEDIDKDRDQILADQWGNLVQRVVTFAHTHYAGQVPTPAPGWQAEESATGRRIRAAWDQATGELEAVRLKEALDIALGLVRDTNRSFHEAKPWAATEPDRSTIVYETLWAIRAANVLLAPYLPGTAEKVATELGTPADVRPGAWDAALRPLTPATPLGKAVPLFPKPAREPTPPPPEEVPLDIRIALIQEVKLHPDAEKLYVLTLDDGTAQPRTLVAGLRNLYTPEELTGKRVAILANLAPRKLRGILSQGMVLAAEDESTVSVLEAPTDTPAGTRLAGAAENPRTVSYDEFSQVRLEIVAEGDAGAAARWGKDGTPKVLTLASGGLLRPGRRLRPGAKIR